MTTVNSTQEQQSTHNEQPLCNFIVAGLLADKERPSGSGQRVPSPEQDHLSLIQMRAECQRLTTENMDLKKTLEDTLITKDSFKGNDKKVQYYTGLPNFLTLKALFEFVETYIPIGGDCSLTKFQKVILVLIKLRLNLPVHDLAYRFGVSRATVSRTFLSVIHVLFIRLKDLIYWPRREELRLSMPMVFRKDFGVKVAVIVDCFEILIERPSNLLARAQTWSSSKHQNTIKFLIGVTPQGSISFISKAWGGLASDKYITEHSGILDKLVPGDFVLAARGLDIKKSVGLICAEIKSPSFTKGEKQLHVLEVESTRNVAHVGIHVKRAVEAVRKKYIILSRTIPVDYLMNDSDNISAIEKIVTVCCCLMNMCESVVPFD